MKKIIFLNAVIAFMLQSHTFAQTPLSSESDFSVEIRGFNWLIHAKPARSVKFIELHDQLVNMDFVALTEMNSSKQSYLKGGLMMTTTMQSTAYQNQTDPLNYFKNAKGIGPMITYDRKITDKVEFSISLRGLHEFDIKHRPDQESYQLTFHLQY